MQQTSRTAQLAGKVTASSTVVSRPAEGNPFGWLPSAEWALVWVTIVLAFFTYRLWAATSKMVKSTERDMRASIDQATRAASAMEAIATSVAASAASAGDAVGAIKDQMVLLKRSYIANNPPILEIRDVVLDTTGEDDDVIEFTVINVGGSTATIIELGAVDDWTGLGRQLPIAPEFKAVADTPPGTQLEPSAALRCKHICTGDSMARHIITGTTDMPQSELFFIGYVVFEDDNRIRQRLDFRRSFDRKTNSFSVRHDQ